MSRPYQILGNELDDMRKHFEEQIKNLRTNGSKFTLSFNVPEVKAKDKVLLTFSMKAYIKMRDVVSRFSSEVGWYGFVDKISDLEYHITDIVLYPQLVTGGTVKEGNDAWDDDMPIDLIKRRHFHGHSHVNMGCTPSSTDMAHRNDQLAMVAKDSFYIFMITNKACDWTAEVYDLANNKVYTTDDILIDVDLGDGEMLSDFVIDGKKIVKTSTVTEQKKLQEGRNMAYGLKDSPLLPHSAGYAQSAWMPKSSQAVAVAKTGTKTTEASKKKDCQQQNQKLSASQLSLLDLCDDDDDDEMTLAELYAYQNGDYYDDILGHVSDMPPIYAQEFLNLCK